MRGSRPTYDLRVTTAQSPTLVTLAELHSTQRAYLRFQRAVRVLAPLGVLALTATGLHDVPATGTSRGAAIAALVVFAGAATGALLARGRPPLLHVCLLALLVCAAVTLVVTGPGRIGLLGLLIAAALLPVRPRGSLGLAGAVAAALLVLVAVVLGNGVSLVNALFTAVSLGCIAAATYLARRLGAANALAEALLRDLDASRARELRLAAIAERQSMARELHDVLAHSLSGLLLQVEGARALAVDAPEDPRLPVALDRAHHLAKAGLDEARQAIGALRDDDALPGPDQLGALVERFACSTGVPCELDVSGEQRALPADVRLSVYRVAQEALTNITKHAAAERASVRLAYEPTQVRLVIEDVAPLAMHDDPSEGGGYGLSGMGERAELLGGRLSAGATPTGFRIELAVPA